LRIALPLLVAGGVVLSVAMADRSLKSGSASTIDALYTRHWSELCNYVKKTFGAGPPEPEDVVQQAFVSLAAVADLQAVQNVRAYLYRTAHNIVVDERRRASSRNEAVIALFPQLQQKSDDLTPESVLMAKERLAVLKDAIRALPEERRRSFIFNRLHGLSCAEIARRTGYSDSAVKKHIALAMDALEAALTAAERIKHRPGGLR
jgi:RNA polymerase sigma factor (sigma-70 family)